MFYTPHPPPPLSRFFVYAVLWILCNWDSVCGCPHYLFDADYSLLDCCGLVVRLPLGLSVVRRLDLSGQAKYFFIRFKETSKTKQQQEQHK